VGPEAAGQELEGAVIAADLIGAEQNSTVVFPMPIDLMKPMIQALSEGPEADKVAQAAHEQADATLEAGRPGELGPGDGAGNGVAASPASAAKAEPEPEPNER